MSASKVRWNPEVVTHQRKQISRAAFDANLRDLAGVLYRFYGGRSYSDGRSEEFKAESILTKGEKQ